MTEKNFEPLTFDCIIFVDLKEVLAPEVICNVIVVQYQSYIIRYAEHSSTDVIGVDQADCQEKKKRLSVCMTKPTKWYVRPAKTQNSLNIRPVGSVYAVRSMSS